MFERIKTIILVSIITILVWVFAEAESLQRRDFHYEIQFASDSPSERYIEADDGSGWRDGVKISFSGSATALSQAEALAANTRNNPLKLTIGIPAIPSTPGEKMVSMREALREIPQIRNLGLSIDRVEPSEVMVRIESLETRTARIVVNVGDAQLDGVPEVKPATARIYVPTNLAASLGAAPDVFAVVRPDELSRLLPGRREVVPQVKLELPADLRGNRAARIEPPTVPVSLTLRVRQASTELIGVPVQVRMAPGELSRWDVSIPEQDRFVPKVTVSGPSNYIDQVKSGEIKVTATVNLSFEDLEKGITQKEISFNDAPGYLKFETDTRLVRLNIKKREK